MIEVSMNEYRNGEERKREKAHGKEKKKREGGSDFSSLNERHVRTHETR